MFFVPRHILSCFCIGSLLFAVSPAALCAGAGAPGQNAATPPAADVPSDTQDWQSIDSGTRPAYAGIQGGTAPLTVLRSSNGLLFAFTGQTGNDFTLVLRGNSANASSPRPKEQTEHPAMAEQSAGAQDAALSPEREEALSRIADEAHARQRTVASSTQLSVATKADTRQPDNAAANEHQADAVEESAVAATPKTSTDAPAQELAGAPAVPLAVPASALPHGNSLAETLAAPAAEAPVLIFASGDLASEISVSEAVVPFGLPLPGERMGTPPPPLPEFPPLKLRDYRSILNTTESL